MAEKWQVPDDLRFGPIDQRVSDEMDRIMTAEAGMRDHLLRKLLLEYYLRDITNVRLIEDRRDPLQTKWHFEVFNGDTATVDGDTEGKERK